MLSLLRRLNMSPIKQSQLKCRLSGQIGCHICIHSLLTFLKTEIQDRLLRRKNHRTGECLAYLHHVWFKEMMCKNSNFYFVHVFYACAICATKNSFCEFGSEVFEERKWSLFKSCENLFTSRISELSLIGLTLTLVHENSGLCCVLIWRGEKC